MFRHILNRMQSNLNSLLTDSPVCSENEGRNEGIQNNLHTCYDVRLNWELIRKNVEKFPGFQKKAD